MQRCPICNIEIGGDLKECPLCKARLEGEKEAPYWPEQSELKKTSKIYKMQLKLLIFACIVVFFIDGLFNPFPDIQWWPLFLVWTIVIEIVIRSIMRKYRPIPRIVTECTIAVCVLVAFSAIWFPEFLFIIPILMTGMVIVDFCFAITDKKGYSTVFFIWSFFISILSFILVFIIYRDFSFIWYICLGTCAAAFIVTLIVKGRFLFSEIKRRMSP